MINNPNTVEIIRLQEASNIGGIEVEPLIISIREGQRLKQMKVRRSPETIH